MNRRLRKPDGTYKTIHGYAVLEMEEYRGWRVRRHWGGWIAEKTIDGGAVIETQAFPKRILLLRSINAWEQHAKDKYGIDNAPPRGQNMVRRA